MKYAVFIFPIILLIIISGCASQNSSAKTNTQTTGDNNISNTAAETANTVVDEMPPVISNVASMSITQNSAEITWNTDEIGDSQIEYGTTKSYGYTTALNTAMVTSHSQSITGLNPNTLYHYRVRSRDATGNSASSYDYTFTTLATGASSGSSSSGESSSSGQTQQEIEDILSDMNLVVGIDSVGGTTIALRNRGSVVLPSIAISIYVDGVLTQCSGYSQDPIAIGGVGTCTLPEPCTGKVVKVTTPGSESSKTCA